jgi:predicted membrane channel-forming protein YqfA (hemolysin III family)
MPDENDLIIIGTRKKTNPIFWIFFALIGFITIFYPFFGSNLRFTVGNFFSGIFRAVGIICYTLGGIIFVWSLFTMICTRSLKAIKPMIIGLILLMIANFFFFPGTFGVFTHGEEFSQGYT